MADVEKATIEKAAKLFEVFKDLHTKQADILAEIDCLLAGKPTIGTRIKQLEKDFQAAWNIRYAGAYAFTPQDVVKPMEKRLLKLFTNAQLRDRFFAYVRDSDPFLVDKRHPFLMFERQANKYADLSQADPDDFELGGRPPGCKHDPACSDAAAHTKRHQRDMRTAGA